MATDARDVRPPLSDEELEGLFYLASSHRPSLPLDVREALAAIPDLIAEVRRLRGAADHLQFHHALSGLPCGICAEYSERTRRAL